MDFSSSALESVRRIYCKRHCLYCLIDIRGAEYVLCKSEWLMQCREYRGSRYDALHTFLCDATTSCVQGRKEFYKRAIELLC